MMAGDDKKEETNNMPLATMLIFVLLAGISSSQILYAFQALANGFDLLWFLGLIVFGFLFVLSFVVILSIVYILDHGHGRIKKRIAFVDKLLGDEVE
jgi:hypothetical protein